MCTYCDFYFVESWLFCVFGLFFFLCFGIWVFFVLLFYFYTSSVLGVLVYFCFLLCFCLFCVSAHFMFFFSSPFFPSHRVWVCTVNHHLQHKQVKKVKLIQMNKNKSLCISCYCFYLVLIKCNLLATIITQKKNTGEDFSWVHDMVVVQKVHQYEQQFHL